MGGGGAGLAFGVLGSRVSIEHRLRGLGRESSGLREFKVYGDEAHNEGLIGVWGVLKGWGHKGVSGFW